VLSSRLIIASHDHDLDHDLDHDGRSTPRSRDLAL
jgi:hypothetical protein